MKNNAGENVVQNDAIAWMLSSAKLEIFYLEYFDSAREQYPDLRWIVKLETRFLSSLRFNELI